MHTSSSTLQKVLQYYKPHCTTLLELSSHAYCPPLLKNMIQLIVTFVSSKDLIIQQKLYNKVLLNIPGIPYVLALRNFSDVAFPHELSPAYFLTLTLNSLLATMQSIMCKSIAMIWKPIVTLKNSTCCYSKYSVSYKLAVNTY